MSRQTIARGKGARNPKKAHKPKPTSSTDWLFRNHENTREKPFIGFFSKSENKHYRYKKHGKRTGLSPQRVSELRQLPNHDR